MDSSVVGAGAKKKSSAETINESGVAVSVTDCGAPTPTPPHDGPALLHLNGEQQDVCLELTHHARYAFQRRRFQQKINNFFFSLSLARFFFRHFSSSFFFVGFFVRSFLSFGRRRVSLMTQPWGRYPSVRVVTQPWGRYPSVGFVIH